MLGIRRFFFGSGIGIGTVMAMILSWTANKSILLAIVHGICSWIYVVYYFVVRFKPSALMGLRERQEV